MGNPYTGDIYELAEGQRPDPGHVPLTKEQADQMRGLPREERIEELQRMVKEQAGGAAAAPAQEQTETAPATAMSTKVLTVQAVARICHEANRALCETRGDMSQKPWNLAEDWQKDSAVAGVEFALNNPDATAEQQHDAWCDDKMRAGWVYGETKDADAKTHPCLVAYHRLPPEQQAKDHLFRSIVAGLRPYIYGY